MSSPSPSPSKIIIIVITVIITIIIIIINIIIIIISCSLIVLVLNQYNSGCSHLNNLQWYSMVLKIYPQNTRSKPEYQSWKRHADVRAKTKIETVLSVTIISQDKWKIRRSKRQKKRVDELHGCSTGRSLANVSFSSWPFSAIRSQQRLNEALSD